MGFLNEITEIMDEEELRGKIASLEAEIGDIKSAEPNVIEQAKLTASKNNYLLFMNNDSTLYFVLQVTSTFILVIYHLFFHTNIQYHCFYFMITSRHPPSLLLVVTLLMS
jgi:hypothetical protein